MAHHGKNAVRDLWYFLLALRAAKGECIGNDDFFYSFALRV